MQIHEFQEMMKQLYFKRDSERGINGTFNWLVDEVTKLRYKRKGIETISGGSGIFDAKITGNVAVSIPSDVRRFVYAFEEVQKTVAGYGADAWTARSGGRTGRGARR